MRKFRFKYEKEREISKYLYVEFDEKYPQKLGTKVYENGERHISYAVTYEIALERVKNGIMEELFYKDPEKEYILTLEDIFL